jgi:DNA repair photolyase
MGTINSNESKYERGTTNDHRIAPDNQQLENSDKPLGPSRSVEDILGKIHTTPGFTSDGKPFDHMVQKKVGKGEYRLECIPADILGTARPIEVYRAKRAKNNIIKPWPSNPKDNSYCPAHWADIAIGRGACGFRCRACFLTLTHRTFCDPSRHALYENVDDYEQAVRKKLLKPGRDLGLGIDCSDSLLYEGITGHARRLIPLFANRQTNPYSRKLILLTKSANVRYLEELPTANVLMTFSLNPEPIADLWEGKWNDGLRITPRIEDRLTASAKSQEMGYEIRWRIDPILPVDKWAEIYHDFFVKAADDGHRPSRITLGTYREMGRSLLTMAAKWGLPQMEWTPPRLVKDGMHYHIDETERIKIYRQLADSISVAWGKHGSVPIIALCKETRTVREAVGIVHNHCNCE